MALTAMLMLMEITVIYLALILVGLCMGSFAGASVWRLRARQLVEDKAAGEKVDAAEYKRLNKLTKAKTSQDRSQCLHCDYTLKWYDLIPLISWVSLGGKCRRCRKPIGWFEPLIELSVALFFVASYLWWPVELTNTIAIARFGIWLAAGVGLAILFAYDAKWFLLPNRVTFTIIALGGVSAVLAVLQSPDVTGALISLASAVVILSGLYYILYLISKGGWIGFGDIKLGLALALLLGDWKLAFIALFSANLIGCLLVLPAMVQGTVKRNTHIPFGPLLIVGTIIAQLAGAYLVELIFPGLI